MQYDMATRFKDFSESLPNFQETLIIPRPLRARLSRLEPEELDTLQLLINHGTIQDTLDHSHVADHTLLNDIARLLSEGYMAASTATGEWFQSSPVSASETFSAPINRR